MRRLRFLNWIVLCFTVGSTVYAGGFRVSLQGVKQAAMGHTGIAVVHDASSVFFNPAGIAELEDKWSFSVSGFAVAPNVEYQNRDLGITTETEKNIGTPLAAYAAYKPNDRLAIGLGIYTPYGSTLEWEDNWIGRTLIEKIALKAIFVQPTLAYKINKNFSLGAGLIVAFGQVGLERDVDIVGNYGHVKFDEKDAKGLGYNLGALYTSSNKTFTAGINYRSNVEMKARDGDVTFTDIPNAVQGPNGPFVTLNDKFDADLPLVDELTLGVAFRPIEKLLLSVDANYTYWGKYKSLTFDFDQNLIGNDPNDPTVSINNRKYEDKITIRVGGQYDLTDKLVGRLGYYYDPSPSPSQYFSPETPTVDNHGFTGGLGYNLGNLTVDGYFAYLYGKERSFNNIDTGFSGDILSNAYILGLGLSYKL